MNKIEKLKSQLRIEQEKLYKKEELPKLKNLVGSYWKYRNSYSGPTKPEDYWWLYCRVDKLQENERFLETTEFQIDSDGKIEIKGSHIYNADCFLNGYKSIDKEEFEDAFFKLIKKVKDKI